MAVESVFNLPYTPPWALKNLKTLPFSKKFPVKLFLFQNFSVKTLPFLKFSCKNSSFFIDQTSKIFLFENFSWWIGKLFLFSNEFGPSTQILPVGYPPVLSTVLDQTVLNCAGPGFWGTVLDCARNFDHCASTVTVPAQSTVLAQSFTTS